MKIAIDARVLEKQMTGIGRYLWDILVEIPKYDTRNSYFLLSTQPLKNYDNNFYTNIVLDKISNRKLFSPFWLNILVPSFLKKEKIDIFFSPNNLCPIFSLKNTKKIITIHDVMFKIDRYYYSFFYRKYLDIMLKKSIDASDKIITISNCSKNDIVKYYSINPDKIDVIYRVADNKFQPRTVDETFRKELNIKYGLPDKFVLYVGLIENRKNIKTILKSADLVSKQRQDIKFILIGNKGFGFNNIKTEIEKRQGTVKYLRFVDDKDLPFLYNLASIFFLTSYYEGFGLPVLEAMQSGTPVVTSNVSSLPEVVGEAGFMCSPEDAETFASLLIKLIEDEKLYSEFANKAVAFAQKFNRNTVIKQHLNIFNSFQ
jgi:glycosyltransferase involved in cell wall biosynthesis